MLIRRDFITTLQYWILQVVCLLRSPFPKNRAFVAILIQKNGKQNKKEIERLCVKLDFFVCSCRFYHPDDKTLSLAVYTKS